MVFRLSFKGKEVMLLCMRTTIDMPDGLMSKVRRVTAERNMTFRALVIDALDKEIRNKPGRFQLRDASAGYETTASVTSDDINRALDEQRDERLFR